MNGRLLFSRVLALPEVLEPSTIYIVPRTPESASLYIVGESVNDVREITSYSLDDLRTISLTSQLPDLSLFPGVEIRPGDSVMTAIGKLQSQVTDVASTVFDTVPTEFKATNITVRLPHLRMMSWDGDRYVRSPWHRPGELFHSMIPQMKIQHGIPVRSDIVYNSENYPDLAELLGVTGPTFTLPEARGRVIRNTDQGLNLDVSLINGFLQNDGIPAIIGSFKSAAFYDGGNVDLPVIQNNTGVFTSEKTDTTSVSATRGISGKMTKYTLDSSSVIEDTPEVRVKSIAATLYVTI